MVCFLVDFSFNTHFLNHHKKGVFTNCNLFIPGCIWILWHICFWQKIKNVVIKKSTLEWLLPIQIQQEYQALWEIFSNSVTRNFLHFSSYSFTYSFEIIAIWASLTGHTKCFLGGNSCFLHFFGGGGLKIRIVLHLGLLSANFVNCTELETHTLCISVARELPWYCYDVIGCQDTSILDHAYRRAFIDEYTQQYSLTPRASPSGLMNIASW